MNASRLFALLFAVGLLLLLLSLFGLYADWNATLRGMLAGAGSGLVLSAAGYRLMPRWWRDEADEEYREPASRGYRRTALPAMTLYLLLLMLSMGLLKAGIASVPLRALVALLPVAPIGWVMHALLRYLREVDELKRRIELEAVGVGAMLVSLAYLAGGFLQLARVIDLPAGTAMIWVFPMMALGYALGKFLAQRRYR
ncbi:MAG: hypothetical protein Q4F49_01425 [Pseudoxanthomonas suwonensis]|nr:hypothetical protein [Pseudoxanthomonas suwonensis]